MGLRNYVCTKCDRAFESQHRLKYHIEKDKKCALGQTKKGGKAGPSLVCGHAFMGGAQCDKKFWQASALRDHVDFVHLGKRVHTCSLCDRAFESKSALRYHLKHHGPNPEKKIECASCKKTFTR